MKRKYGVGMDEKMDKNLREKGYIPVEEYTAEYIGTNGNLFEKGNAAQVASAIRVYEEASEQFHRPGGDGYYIAQRCLQRYLDLKFLQKNRKFRFAESEGEYEYVPRKKGGRSDRLLTGTQADIYYLLFEAGQESFAGRRCRDYASSGKLHLTAVMTELLEQAVSMMEESESAKIQEYGRLLRTAYMDPVFADLEAAELYKKLGYSKKQYYNLRSKSISLISEYLFGFFAGEKGMAEVYIRRDSIVIPAAENFE